jgi:hypothetical protein
VEVFCDDAKGWKFCALSACAVAAVILSAAPAMAQKVEWAKMPTMRLERQFAGPLQDTIIQRWRDPADGTVCYVYLPITAAHSPPTESGYVQYGSNTIGSISCSVPSSTNPPVQAQTKAPAPKRHVAQPAPPKPLSPPAAAPSSGE